MSWYLQWSDSIKKRACRYLLQRYLGQFLEEKLTLDQLNVDIYCGTGSVSNVSLDVQALNELGENKNLPFEFVDGFISGISVSIPWANLFTESIYVEVSGMQITIQPKQRPDNAASMLESMWSSMASSIQLAAECLKNEPPPAEEKDGENVNNMEGLEIFAQAIESILTRVKVKLVNTCIRLEHLPKEGRNGIALEVRIKNIKYCDETTCDVTAEEAADNPQFSSSFAIKKFFCDGISFFTDEFPVEGRTISKSLIVEDKDLNFKSQDKTKDHLEPVLIGKLSGYQDITLKLKMDPSAVGPKVDFELNLGSLIFFLTPRQLYLLIEITQSLASPHTQDTSNVSSKKRYNEKMMSSRDFKKVEQDLQETLSFPSFIYGPPQVISQGKGWSSPSLEDTEDEFLPMQLDNGMSGSVMSDNTTDTSFTSNTSGTYVSKSDTWSQHNVPLGGLQSRRKHEKGFSFDASEMLEDTCAFHMRLSSLAMVVLHEDILTLRLDTCELTPSSVSTMKNVSEEFFSQLGRFAVSGNKDFEASKEAFLRSCKHNHIRLLGATVIVEGNESRNGLNSFFSSFISVASLELLECLVEKDSFSSGEPQYVELLKFINTKNSQFPIKPQAPLTNQPDLRMHMQRVVKHRHSRVTSCTEISLRLEQCWSELDLSIFDRISTIMAPQKLCHTNSSKEVMDQQLSFTQAVESSTHSVKTFYFKAQSPVFVIKFRFPIPDLRPPHEKGRFPWWQRSVRKDVLFINMVDATFVTDAHCESYVQEYHVACKELTLLFQEGGTDIPIPFIVASGDSPTASASDPYPRVLVRLCPTHVTGVTDDSTDKDDGSAGLSYSTFLDNSNKEPSPFMSKKVVHESDTHHRTASDGEELIIPGCKEDIEKFIDYALEDSKVHLEVILPFLSVEFPSKHLYEVIYNRLSSDLSLWQSSAPKNNTMKSGANGASSLIQPSFSMCKSGIQYDSEESDEDVDDDFIKTPKGVSNNHQNQSYFTLSVKVNKGVLDVCPNLKDLKNVVIPDKFGELYFDLQDGNLFFVSNFKGRNHKNYVCLQVKSVEVYHKACVDLLSTESKAKHSETPPAYLDPILLKSSKEMQVTSMNPEGADGCMLVTAVSTEVNERRMKTIKVACSLNGATLKHRVSVAYRSWLTQFMDFFDVVDYPVKGYDSPQIITELYFHLWDSAVDYRPLYLPYRCVITMGNLSISSNIAARTKTSTLRFIAEEGNLFISDVENSYLQPNLRSDYVSVMQLGLFELSLRLSDQANLPKMDLKASNNILHIRTCSDSAAALAQLITYFASDGDLVKQEKAGSPTKESPVTADVISGDKLVDMTESTVVHVNDMMEDAMKEISGAGGNVSGANKSDGEKDMKDEDIEVFFFPDEGNGVNHTPVDWGGMDNEHDFCVLDHETGITGCAKSETGQPTIHVLIENPVEIIENHFNISVGKSDLLRTPKCYPSPNYKYMLSDMTVVWHMYGGKDFSAKSSKKNVKFEKRESSSATSSPIHKPRNGKRNEDLLEACYSAGKLKDSHTVSINRKKKSNSSTNAAVWITAGGPNRQHDVLMELQFNKVKFLHEIYPEQSLYASRQVLLIHEFEIRDKLSSSRINKFLYQYSSESSPRQSNANMMVIKAVHLRPDPRQNIQETCLKVSVLPLRLNIDQDSLQFLVSFFSQLSGMNYVEDEDSVSATTPTPPNPVMRVDKKEVPADVNPSDSPKDDAELKPAGKPSSRRSTVYIRNFVFSPEVPIRIDYEGKHVDLTHGPLAGLLMGLGQLNCLQIKLKRLSYKHGLLGFDKLVSYAMNEWIQDIKKTQVPCLLGGVGPMHALVQLFQGIRDLFWLPIEQYQKDGRIVRGLQRGANSFTTSTAIAALELTARIVQAIQSIAEAAFDMVSPGPSVRRLNGAKYKKQHHVYSHPADIREGVTNAYTLVKEGLGETAETIVRVASAEAEQKGAVGAVGGVLRQIPPSVVQQLILASAATSNLLSGVRSQLAPDSRREAANKWKKNVPDE